jgi:hypothetical protein
VQGYAAAYRNHKRVATAHVESTVNQLVNWRFCKKQRMSWTRAGAQGLLHVKTAMLNKRLGGAPETEGDWRAPLDPYVLYGLKLSAANRRCLQVKYSSTSAVFGDVVIRKGAAIEEHGELFGFSGRNSADLAGSALVVNSLC